MATHHDADTILKLYDLRRESEMRKARNYVGLEFWPESIQDFATVQKPGDPNRYWRQALSFWEMAAQLALHGAVDEKLFIDTAGEMFFFFAKYKPFIADLRQHQPEVFKAMETLINKSETSKEKLAAFEKRVAILRENRKQQMKANA